MSEDLFGNTIEPVPAKKPAVFPAGAQVNSMDTVMAVLERALADCGYLIAGRGNRVFRRTDTNRMRPVPVWEGHAVHQLVGSGQLTTGGCHHMSVGAVRYHAQSVLVPKSTRNQVLRWKSLKRPSTWGNAKGA